MWLKQGRETFFLNQRIPSQPQLPASIFIPKPLDIKYELGSGTPIYPEL